MIYDSIEDQPTLHTTTTVASNPSQALDAYKNVFAEKEGDASLFYPSFCIDNMIVLSHLALMERCFAHGTVLAVTLKPDEHSGGTGYAAAS